MLLEGNGGRERQVVISRWDIWQILGWADQLCSAAPRERALGRPNCVRCSDSNVIIGYSLVTEGDAWRESSNCLTCIVSSLLWTTKSSARAASFSLVAILSCASAARRASILGSTTLATLWYVHIASAQLHKPATLPLAYIIIRQACFLYNLYVSGIGGHQ